MSTASRPTGVTPSMVTWVQNNVSGLGQVTDIALLSGGRSNLTYLLTGPTEAKFVLRRPPLGEVLASAHDMHREWRYISALRDTPVPVANGRAFCDDREVGSCDFYVMDHVEGAVLSDQADGAALTPKARRRASVAMVEALAALHQQDPVAIGVVARLRTGEGQGLVDRQITRWTTQISAIDFPERDVVAAVRTELLRAVPPERTGIVHGDYRPGNLAFTPSGGIAAVFDWELATVGDVLTDLGWLLASWEEPGDGDAFLPISDGPTGLDGFLTRAEVAEHYAADTGHDLDRLDWYLAYARWRMACIGVGVRHRYSLGAMEDDGFAVDGLDDLIPGLAEAALTDLRRP